MKLAQALDEKKLDIRLMDRHLAQGRITKEDITAGIENLQDEEGNYEVAESTTAKVAPTESAE
jgi:hypothetical protein